MLQQSLIRRLGWREVLSSRTNSILITLLVALPVASAVTTSALLLGSLPIPETSSSSEFGHFSARLDPTNGPVDLDTIPEVAAGEGAQRLPVSTGRYTSPILIGTGPFDDPLGSPRWNTMSAPAKTEVVVTREFATLLEVAEGDTIEIVGEPYRIANVVRLSPWLILAGGVPGILVGKDHPLAPDWSTGFLSAIPSQERIAELESVGIFFTSRADQIADFDSGETALLGVFLTAGLLVLLLVLGTIVSAAFGMNLQRRRQILALLQATGATRSQIRGIILWQSVFLGALGAIAGLLLGNVLTLAIAALNDVFGFIPLVEPLISPWHQVAFFSTSVATTALIAWLTAHKVLGQDALAALKDARGASQRARFPWVGILLALIAAWLTYRTNHYGELLRSGHATSDAQLQATWHAVFAGISYFLAGLTSLAWLVQRFSSPASGPLAFRLAIRDSARNISRTLATAAATGAATVLTLIPLLLIGAQNAYFQNNVEPWQMPGLVSLTDWQDDTDPRQDVDPHQLTTAAAITREVLGNPLVSATTYRLDQAGEALGFYVQGPVDEQGSSISHSIEIANPELLQVLAPRSVAAIEQALAEGKAVALAAGLAPAGQVQVVRTASEESMEFLLPAVELADLPYGPVLLSPESAAQFTSGAAMTPVSYLKYDKPVTATDLERVRARLLQAGIDVYPAADTGPDQSYQTWLIPTAIIGIVISVAIAGVAGSLGFRDTTSTRILAANVGAGTPTMRTMAAVQAILGSMFGVAIGGFATVIPATVLISGLGMPVPALPWALVALVLSMPTAFLTLFAAAAPVPQPTRMVKGT